jgi:hypothetical protein
VNVCELKLEGIENERQLATARWELFVFPEIRDVRPLAAGSGVTVVFEGEPDAERWTHALEQAGFVKALAA